MDEIKEEILISDVESLIGIRNNLSGCYKLVADLDLTGVDLEPIGTQYAPFKGTFEGNGHVIRNMYKEKGGDYTGLFDYANGAKLKDLKMEDCTVIQTAVGRYTGVLAGYLDNCIMENIHLKRVNVKGADYTGTLAGYVNNGSITGCAVNENSKVEGSSQVGGLIGAILGKSTITKLCCAVVNVTGYSSVGGLVGQTNGSIINSFTLGSVTATNSSYVAGLVGYSASNNIDNCYAACNITPSGKGLASGYPIVTSSYFDSSILGITTPTSQARTTEQMLSKETYVDWDWDNIWLYKANGYPILMGIEAITQEPFKLTSGTPEYFSVVIECQDIPKAKRYDIFYLNKVESSTTPRVLIKDLDPDTEYEFKACAVIDETTRVWSKTIKIRTKKLLSIEGLHATSRDANSITLTWKPVEGAKNYEVIYNDKILNTNTNTCTLTNLSADASYVISVKTISADGSIVTGTPIVERIYNIAPQTDYAKEFIAKCEGQSWFLNEIENILNLKGKSINTITSQRDLACIYAIGLANRGVSGKIPVAIGELRQLQYLYLANNDLSGKIPDEIKLLDRLVEADFSGNNFAE